MPANAPSIPLCVMPRNANTVIAARIGVDEATVRRTRKKSTSANAMLKKRTGKDGKARKRKPQRGERVGGLKVWWHSLAQQPELNYATPPGSPQPTRGNRYWPAATARTTSVALEIAKPCRCQLRLAHRMLAVGQRRPRVSGGAMGHSCEARGTENSAPSPKSCPTA